MELGYRGPADGLRALVDDLAVLERPPSGERAAARSRGLHRRVDRVRRREVAEILDDPLVRSDRAPQRDVGHIQRRPRILDDLRVVLRSDFLPLAGEGGETGRQEDGQQRAGPAPGRAHLVSPFGAACAGIVNTHPGWITSGFWMRSLFAS